MLQAFLISVICDTHSPFSLSVVNNGIPGDNSILWITGVQLAESNLCREGGTNCFLKIQNSQRMS